MSINELIIAALEPTGILVTPDEKEADDQIYFVFGYDTVPALHGNDAPVFETAFVQVHLYAPTGANTVALRKRAKQLLYAGGFTWPEMVDASDKEGQHWVFECEATQEVAPGGEA